MDKKYAEAFEAFEQCRFEDCLRQVEQMFKKIDKADGKKKNQLSDKEMQNIYLIKAGSLAATGEVHQSNALMKSYFPTPIISQDMSFLFLQICSMAMDERLSAFTIKIDEGREKQKIDINRFLLLNKNYEVLSRIFLRQYMTQKKHEDALAQIYLEYLKQITPYEPIKYSRNTVIKEHPNANLKMVSMFLNKFLSGFNLKEKFENNAQALARHKKIKTSIADLLIKIAIHEGNAKVVRDLFTEWYESLGMNKFTYLRSILQMKNEKDQNFLLWIKTYLSIFHFNLALDTYEPVYDYSIEFIDGFIAHHKLDFSVLKEPTQLPQQNLYQYMENPVEQFQNYFSSLYTEYTRLVGKKQNKTKDFYRISVKNVLLLLLHISSQSHQYDFASQILLSYKQNFGLTLTFPSEIESYIKNQKILTPEFGENKFKPINQTWKKADDQLIWYINQQIMFPKQLGSNPYAEWDRIVNLYEKNVNQVEKLRGLQKGQRYLSDQFLTVAADSVRQWVEKKQQLSQSQFQEACFYILNILEKAIGRSPYNFDLKLRAIYFMEKLGYFQQIIEMLETNDIKAVQFDTLGYLYLKQIIHYSLFETNEALLVRMVRSYQQNFRESSEYGFKALKAASINQCAQNLSYNDHIDRSYNWCIVLFAFYLKNRGKPDSEFYLQEIIRRLNNPKGQTFNSDFRVMRNAIQREGSHFTDFYGIYNCKNILKNQCLLKKMIWQINSKKPFEEIFEHLKEIKCDWTLKDLYDFKDFQFFERKIESNCGQGKYHHERQNQIVLNLYNKIVELTLSIISFCQAIAQNGEIKQKCGSSMQKIKDVREIIKGQSLRNIIKLLPFTRQHYTELISLVAGINQSFLGKNKKKVEGKVEKKECCLDLINAMIASVSEDIMMGEMNFGERQRKNEIMHQRDEVLRRMTGMSAQQFKKIYKIKL